MNRHERLDLFCRDQLDPDDYTPTDESIADRVYESVRSILAELPRTDEETDEHIALGCYWLVRHALDQIPTNTEA